MLSKRVLFGAVVGLSAALAMTSTSPAWAQTVGNLSGHVYDQSGTPIRGVKVTASSDIQIGGPKSTFTREQGYFRKTGPSPGTLTVTAAAHNPQTGIHKTAKVTPAATPHADSPMAVENPA